MFPYLHEDLYRARYAKFASHERKEPPASSLRLWFSILNMIFALASSVFIPTSRPGERKSDSKFVCILGEPLCLCRRTWKNQRLLGSVSCPNPFCSLYSEYVTNIQQYRRIFS